MNVLSIIKRVLGVGAAAFFMAALSPLATAHADSYVSSYSTVITANPVAAVSQGALLVNLFPQQPTRVFPQDPTRVLPQEPSRVLPPVVGLWG
jgi:hypothetical protein